MPSLLTFTKILSVLVLVIETQGQWFTEKFKHAPKAITQDELMKLSGLSTKALTFDSLLDPMLIPRVSGTQNNVAVREYIKKHMNNLGWTVQSDIFEDNTPYGVKQFENIIATLNPDSPRRLVIACHFDSKYFKDIEFVGASDSAVPCAMMLHMAYALEGPFSQHKQSPATNVTLQFIFFDGEEAFVNWSETDSTYGSRHLAQLMENTPYPPGNTDRTTELDRIDVMMLLDLIGPASPTFPNFFESTSHLHNQLVETEQVLRNARMWTGNVRATRPFFSPNSPYGGIEDDHIPFLQRNVDILHLISVPFPKTWHTVRDNRASLDMPTITNINRILRVFVGRYLHLSGLDSSP